MTRLEQETIINFNEAKATANVYTHNAACAASWSTGPTQPEKQSEAAASRTAGGNTPFPNAG